MRLSSFSLAAASLCASLANAAPTAFQGPDENIKRGPALKFPFGTEKVRGVNLGGWFVLEPWITPSIFEATPSNCVDEYTMSATLGKTEMKKRMEKHWSTWITEADFPLMKQYGINMVRIPIGYWSISPLPEDPYVQGAYAWLAKALTWAQKSDIKVMIDLHGAPGSQNGFDNSGRRGAIDWTQGNTVAHTLTTLDRIRDDHAANPAVAAIELVNEPLGPDLNLDTIKSFYDNGWGNLQNTSVAITFHDAFEGVAYWNSWGAGLDNLLLDTHIYQVFSAGALEQSQAQRVSSSCNSDVTAGNKWTICGEFSGGLTDCPKWLNGRGVGARYDGTYNYEGQTSSYIGSCDGKVNGTVDGMSATEKAEVKQFIEAQIVGFEKADGWIFWAWKTESAPQWNFKELVKGGLIPQPLSSIDTSVCD